jgi:hypothetical protein
MFTKDLKTETTSTAILKSQSVTSTTTSAAFDTQPYAGNLLLVANIAAATAGTSPTLDVKVQDCATSGGTYVDVSGYTLTQVTTTDSLQTLSIDKRLVRQFVKVVATLGGSASPAFPVSVTVTGYKQAQ